MIEPYGSVLKSLCREYAELALRVENDADYRVLLSNEKFVLAIATEKTCQPSILASLEDRFGGKFELGLARRILSESSYEVGMKELATIKDQYKLDLGNITSRDQVSGLFIYVKVALAGIFGFLREFGEQVSSQNEAFLAEYKSRERALLGRFGL